MSKTIFNERFAEVYKDLLTRGKVRSKRAFGIILGTYSHVINYLIKGDSQPTINQITALVNSFGINANYIFGKSNIMYIRHIKKTFNLPPSEPKQ